MIYWIWFENKRHRFAAIVLLVQLFLYAGCASATAADQDLRLFAADMIKINRSLGQHDPFKEDFQGYAERADEYMDKIDFDIAMYADARRKVTEVHENAMKWNSIAGLILSGATGILSPSLQYPGSKVSVRAPNDVSIIGAGTAALSSTVALSNGRHREYVTETYVLKELIGPPSGENAAILSYMQSQTLGALVYAGRRVIAIHNKKHPSEMITPQRNAFNFLIGHWGNHFKQTLAEVNSDSNVDGSSSPIQPIKMNGKQLDERIIMLQQMRTLIAVMKIKSQLVATNPNFQHIRDAALQMVVQ